jgi:hypothetical protein
MKRPVKGVQVAIVLSALSWAVSAIPENWLKFAFGRTWPETWMQDNPSLIRDHVYGFNPFHGGPGYAAFPSGHMVAISAIVSVFWFLHPRSRAICAICITIVFIGQLGANYHFAGEVIKSSAPIRYGIVDGMNVRDSRVHNYPPRWNGAPSQDLLGDPAQSQDWRSITRSAALGAHPVLVRGP